MQGMSFVGAEHKLLHVAAVQAGMSVAYCGCTRLIYRAAELPEYRIAACCRTGICC